MSWFIAFYGPLLLPRTNISHWWTLKEGNILQTEICVSTFIYLNSAQAAYFIGEILSTVLLAVTSGASEHPLHHYTIKICSFMLRVYKNVTDGHMNTGFVKVSSRSLLELDDKMMQSVTRGSDRKE